MKIKIDNSVSNAESIIPKLESAGFVISDDAALELIERTVNYIKVINDRMDTILLPMNEIISIESMGKENYIYTKEKKFLIRDTLENLHNKLGSNYIRISKSTIIEKSGIKKIGPSFQMKYKLVLSNGRVVYVTRNYYYSFKEYYGL